MSYLVQYKLLQSGEEADMSEDLTPLQVLVHVQSTKEGLQQVSLVLHLDLPLGVGIHCILGHAQVVTHHGLCPVVDQAGPEEG